MKVVVGDNTILSGDITEPDDSTDSPGEDELIIPLKPLTRSHLGQAQIGDGFLSFTADDLTALRQSAAKSQVPAIREALGDRTTVIATGTPFQGLSLIGPFDDGDAAIAYCEDNLRDNDWSIVEVESADD